MSRRAHSVAERPHRLEAPLRTCDVRARGLLIAILGCCGVVLAQGEEVPRAWDAETVHLFAALPIQDGGRIKPLDTYASFKLLQVNGRRKCRVAESDLPWPLNRMIYPHRKPMAWFLDCLFYPENARAYPMFLVEDADVLIALGAEATGPKRARYPYATLEGARHRLLELAELYARKPAKELDTRQRQLLRLAENISAFEHVLNDMVFLRRTFTVGPSPVLSDLFEGRSELRLSEVLAQACELHERFGELREGADALDDKTRAGELDAFRALFAQLDDVRMTATTLALFPPLADEDPEWLTVSDVVTLAFEPQADVSAHVAWLAQLEAMAAARDDPDRFKTLLREYHASLTGRAKARGEYDKIELEVTFYRAKLFYRALILYIACFLLIALSWVVPRSRFVNALAPIALLAPTALLVAGIVGRCIIRSRPPVTTLYETILFVTAVVVVVALAAEYISRQRIALAVGGILGVLGVLLANKYEVAHAKDTMPSMVAVLDTNFWLTAHVTTITIGYAASLLTGAMAHIYILGRLLGFKRNAPDFYNKLTRMVYGILCFAFFFTLMGTVLGGVWANESWGRFWGWDPKENGALLIVLWQLAVLHARRGGYIRDLGINMAAVFGAAIVAFSWWGINLLGVGLHTYGFTSGTMNALIAYWSFEAVVILLGAAIWYRE